MESKKYRKECEGAYTEEVSNEIQNLLDALHNNTIVMFDGKQCFITLVEVYFTQHQYIRYSIEYRNVSK
jgi:hypothetical protein